jgi:hypothetical protein
MLRKGTNLNYNFMAITSPIALYNNVPVEPQYFKPWYKEITAMTIGTTTTKT